MHPEDAVKHDEKYQDAKQQKEQSQELMQQAWDDKTSPEISNDVSEANKNKVISGKERIEISANDNSKLSNISIKDDTESQSKPEKQEKSKQVKEKSNNVDK